MEASAGGLAIGLAIRPRRYDPTVLARPITLSFVAAWTLATAPATHAAAEPGKPIVYCADASPEGFDPALWDSSSTSNVTTQIF